MKGHLQQLLQNGQIYRKLERRVDTERGMFRNQIFGLVSILFWMSLIFTPQNKEFNEISKSRDQESEKLRERRSPVERFLQNPYYRSKIIENFTCFQIFLLRIDSKIFKGTDIKAIKCYLAGSFHLLYRLHLVCLKERFYQVRVQAEKYKFCHPQVEYCETDWKFAIFQRVR